MNIVKLWTSRWLLGGRPMMLTEKLGFGDKVSEEQVNFYIDSRGRYWMATSPWSWFRVRAWTHEQMVKEICEVIRETEITDDDDEEAHGHTSGGQRP